MRYKKFIIFFIVILCLALALFLLIPKKYESVDKNSSELADKQEPSAADILKETENEKLTGVDASQPSWNFETYQALMTESGRKPGINASTFLEIQKRKKIANQIVDDYLIERLGSTDQEVLRAFNEVPREYFQYQYQENQTLAATVYEDKREKVKPWALGWGSALSDYLGQTYMTQLLKPKASDVALEIGTGSGYQSALLSRIVKKMYSIEIIKPLGDAVSKIFKPLGYENIETRVGDGFYGWPEVKGGFDIIIVTAAAQYVPPALIEQLKPNGTMLIPVGQPFKRGQVLYVYTKDADGRVHSRKDVGVYFIPLTGAIQNNKNSEAQ